MATLEQRRNTAKYIAELYERFEWSPRVAMQDEFCAGESNIYSFSVAPIITDPTNYWIAWGGYFDNYPGLGLQLFFKEFLKEQVSFANMLVTELSFYVETSNNRVYINIPVNPWEYDKSQTALFANDNSSYSTAPKDENNLSDIFYDNVKVPAIMRVPSVNSKLSNSISGVVVYNGMDIELQNQDGMFDAFDIIRFFNTPIKISKTTNNAQRIIDFNTIRRGIINDITVSFDSVRISASDDIYRFEKEVCRRVNTIEFPSATENIDELIPIGWGILNGIELIPLWETGGNFYYIALDKSHITAVSAVYDDSGASQTFSFSSASGIISTTVEVKTADVTGRTNSRIGKIITDVLQEIENLSFIEGVFDITETNAYTAISPLLNFYYEGGTSKDLIQDVLKNDIAFLIQKNDGRLTLRRWGVTYESHSIESWLTTQKPEKDFADASKFYASSVSVNYSNGITVDASRELELFEKYKRSYTATIDTVIRNKTDADNLATRFLARFGDVKETLRVGFGVDIYQVNLLDTIMYNAIINGRLFSNYTTWIVKECDPAQDILILEGVS